MTGIYIAGNFLSQSTSTRSVGEELAERLTGKKYEVITASSSPSRLKRMVDFLWAALRYRREYQIAVIEVYSGLAFRWAEMLAAFLKVIGKPYILSLHGGKLPEFTQNNQRRVKKLLASANRVTTPSRYLVEAFSAIRPDLAYLPNGIELKEYPFSIRKEARPKIVWLRAFHEIYQPVFAVITLGQLSRDFPGAQLTMIGPDKKDGSLYQVVNKIRENGLMDKIKIVGGITKKEVGAYLSQADIFINTTNYESFGVSVMEAAACGLCIVTTNVGELPYLWEDGIEALLVPPNDPQAMAAAVRRILTEPGLAEKLSSNARKKAEQFDWSVILPQWEELIEKVIKNSQQ